MKLLKTVISVATAVAMLTSGAMQVSATQLGYGEEYEKMTEKPVTSSFKDVPSYHWACDSIERCVAKAWFDGYPDGTFRPDGQITRAEALTVFAKFLGLNIQPVSSTSYQDVEPGDWYAAYIEAGSGLLPVIVNFDGSTPFRPNAPVTREDTTYAIVTALGYASETVVADQSVLNMFSDQSGISAICKSYIAVGVKRGLVSGYDDGTFGAQDPLTRAQFAAMLDRASRIGYGPGGAWTGNNGGSNIGTVPSIPSTPSDTGNITYNPGTDGYVCGAVMNAATNTHVAGATVTINGITATTDNEGTYHVYVPAGTYSATATATGFLPGIATIESVSGQTTYAENILLVPESEGAGIVNGTVRDAANGNGIAGATVTFTNGTAASTVTTDENGAYSVSLMVGSYSAEASADNYIAQSKIIVSQADQPYSQDFALTQSLANGQVRFVLTWGATPSDLDSHLTGPSVDNSRFHIYYANKEYSADGTLMTNLDVDDITSYGPETVTIYSKTNGVYRYSVHDFTNRASTTSKALSNSGAKVEVYIGSSLVKTYNVPPNIEGNLWTVCEFNGSALTDINIMSKTEGVPTMSVAAMSEANNNAVDTDEDVIMSSISEK